MATHGKKISGVSVKVRRCACGLEVFDAGPLHTADGRATFDVLPADVMEMVQGRDAIFWHPRDAPSFTRHICPIFIDE